jgi:hypothetical protein
MIDEIVQLYDPLFRALRTIAVPNATLPVLSLMSRSMSMSEMVVLNHNIW